ncbi:metal-dependent transcriptional regulator [Sutterella sp.]|uniref:metal-dependent transcriptional regulator n=1 Tax=Sutterella sp. TaxID=1981025 RepID=UPI0026E10128|nr:metal-dependent transcriptional regulator [Sutterella sp.]MDO5532243.1 metal-dependent transcriptional regulator [Sutterella sp.]
MTVRDAKPDLSSQTSVASGQLSPTRENYLKFIYLEEEQNGYARACNLSELMGVTRSTVALTFRELKADGLIDYAPYSPIRLTPRGRELAREIVRKNAVIKHFFMSVLDLDEEVSERIACELEHVISAPVLGRLTRFEKQLEMHQGFWKAREAEEAGKTARDGAFPHARPAFPDAEEGGSR